MKHIRLLCVVSFITVFQLYTQGSEHVLYSQKQNDKVAQQKKKSRTNKANQLKDTISSQSCRISDSKGDLIKMKEKQKKAIELLSLDDSAYYTVTEQNIITLQEKLGDIFEGDIDYNTPPGQDENIIIDPQVLLAITAPSKVDLSKQNTIPVLIGRCETGLRQWEVDAKQNRCFVAIDCNTGSIYTGKPFVTKKRGKIPEPSRSGKPPDKLNAQSYSSGIRIADIIEIVKPPQHIISLAITFFSYNIVSNTVIVQLTGRETDEKTTRRPLVTSDFLQKTQKTDKSPEPGECGIALSLPPSIKQDDELSIHGTIKIPLPASATTRDENIKKNNNDKDIAAAIVPASLLLFKLDKSIPTILNMNIPVYQDSVPSEGDLVEMFFSLDLCKVLPGVELTGTYQVYLLINKIVEGPFQTTIKTE